NDAGDADTGPDANNFQNFPVITGVFVLPTDNIVKGTINSTPDTHLTIEFFANSSCDPSGYGEGQTYIGTTTVMTDASGDATFTFHPTTLSSGQVVTATATDDNGNTSEFSQCSGGAGATGDIVFTSPNSNVQENVSGGMAQVMVTRSGGSSG